jgi:hypothetical protein
VRTRPRHLCSLDSGLQRVDEVRADVVDGKGRESCGAGPAGRCGVPSTSRPRAPSVRFSTSSSSLLSARTLPHFHDPRLLLLDRALHPPRLRQQTHLRPHPHVPLPRAELSGRLPACRERSPGHASATRSRLPTRSRCACFLLSSLMLSLCSARIRAVCLHPHLHPCPVRRSNAPGHRAFCPAA